jgi:hypothetical protein
MPVFTTSEDSIMVTPPHYLASGITAWIGNPLLGRRGDARLFISIHCFNSDPFQFTTFNCFTHLLRASSFAIQCDLTGRLQLLAPMVSDYRSVIANVREFNCTLVLPGYAVWLKDRVYERPYWPRGPSFTRKTAGSSSYDLARWDQSPIEFPRNRVLGG